VRRRPGLKAKKSAVVTIKSVFVKTRPIALATRLYTRKNTRAWNITAIWLVFPLTNLTSSPVGGQENAWAERQKKGGWDRNLSGK
jgi:hypothetical protein